MLHNISTRIPLIFMTMQFPLSSCSDTSVCTMSFRTSMSAMSHSSSASIIVDNKTNSVNTVGLAVLSLDIQFHCTLPLAQCLALKVPLHFCMRNNSDSIIHFCPLGVRVSACIGTKHLQSSNCFISFSAASDAHTPNFLMALLSMYVIIFWVMTFSIQFTCWPFNSQIIFANTIAVSS